MTYLVDGKNGLLYWVTWDLRFALCGLSLLLKKNKKTLNKDSAYLCVYLSDPLRLKLKLQTVFSIARQRNDRNIVVCFLRSPT
jgi:hypothetical protein